MVGKYVDLHDSYMSISEALTHAGSFRRRCSNRLGEFGNDDPDEMDRELRKVSASSSGPDSAARHRRQDRARAGAREHGCPISAFAMGCTWR